MMLAKQWTQIAVFSTLAASIAISGCGQDKNAAAAGAMGGGKMPPPDVSVVVAQKQSAEQTVDLSGRINAYQSSDVRPQVNGIIQKRLFVEGSFVREGQPLYQIDPNTYQATVDNAKAALDRQTANLNALKVKQSRYQQLVGSNAISKQDMDDMNAQVALAQADVDASKATLQNAQISLGYSIVRAPIAGQTGRSNVTPGALVTASQTSPLVTIQQLDPVYVDISQSSADLLRLRQQLKQGQLSGSSDSTRVKLTLEDGSTYPIEGRLAFSSASVDPTSGSVILRAVFDNPNHLLLPGMYVTAKLVQGVNKNAFLIPQQSVVRTPQGDATVMVVNQQGLVESKTIQTTGTQGSNWIVTDGLNEGDKVIFEGLMKAKPGAPAHAVLATPGQSDASAKSAQAGTNDKQPEAKTGKAQA